MKSAGTHMKTLRLLLTIVTAASCIFCATILTACPYSIRDSAFIGRGSKVPFRLVFLSTSTTPGNDKLAEAVKNAAASWLQDSNVVARVVELDGPEKNEVPTEFQEAYSDDSLLPAAILFSPSGEALELGQLALKDKPLDTIMELMGPVVESPLRRGLQEKLVKNWCVIVFVPGTDKKKAAAALGGIDRIIGLVIIDRELRLAPADPHAHGSGGKLLVELDSGGVHSVGGHDLEHSPAELIGANPADEKRGEAEALKVPGQVEGGAAYPRRTAFEIIEENLSKNDRSARRGRVLLARLVHNTSFHGDVRSGYRFLPPAGRWLVRRKRKETGRDLDPAPCLLHYDL